MKVQIHEPCDVRISSAVSVAYKASRKPVPVPVDTGQKLIAAGAATEVKSKKPDPKAKEA